MAGRTSLAHFECLLLAIFSLKTLSFGLRKDFQGRERNCMQGNGKFWTKAGLKIFKRRF